MHRGYTKAWRKELESQIWQMPPIYHRVWFVIRQKAKYKPDIFPTRNGYGIHLNPGQLITSVRQIAIWSSWSEWGRERIPNSKTVSQVLSWLESNTMITLESNTKGTYISITNWDNYNNLDNEKVTLREQDLVTERGHLLDIIKELNKEITSLKEKNNAPFQALKFLIDHGVDKDIAKEWLKVRKTKRLANTERAFNTILSKIEKTGRSADEIFGVCVDKSWGGFEIEWLNNIKPKDTSEAEIMGKGFYKS